MSWRHQPVGERFRYRYQQHRQRGFLMRLSMVLCGVLLILLGLPLIPLPGPGWVITIAGLGLIGGEFKKVAGMLDWLDGHLFTPVLNFGKRRPFTSTLILWGLFAVMAYLGWHYTPEWEYGPIHWGDLDRTISELKRML